MGLIVRNINFTGNFRGTFPQVPPPPPPPPAPSDQYGAYTVLDLPGTGTNNTNNNVFVDSSANNFAITRYGNTTQGSFSPFSTGAGYWSNYFDGNGDYISVARNSAFLPVANEDFTIEAWVYLTDAPSAQGAGIVGLGEYGLDSDWNINIKSNFEVVFWIQPTATEYKNTIASVTLNSWNHIAVSRFGTGSNNLKVFVNGVGQSFTTNSTTVGTGSRNLTIGADQNGDEFNLTGYISNLRIVKGTALYTTNFTPPTTPLTAVSGTSLLTCQSNRFVDNSSNNFTITRNGDTSVSAFGPYAPVSNYNAATMGGSIYFDGNGDYLRGPGSNEFNFGTGNFTVEGWVYFANTTGPFGIRLGNEGLARPYFAVQTNGNLLFDLFNVASYNLGGSFPIGSWGHFAIVRNGATVTGYINGVATGSITQSGTVGRSDGLDIAYKSDGPLNFNGYAYNIRIVKGTAVYTSNFTPPTAPVSAISGTSLLLNGTNAAILDASTKNNLETVGDAKISTTISANGSMYFDGNGDYLLVPSNPTFGFGTGDFTVETWAYLNSTSGFQVFAMLGDGIDATPVERTCSWSFYFENGAVRFNRYAPTYTDVSFNWTPNTGQWYHIAISRSGTSLRAFVNGLQIGTTLSNGINYSVVNSIPLHIGRLIARGGTAYFSNAYMNNLRITKGIARYTSNFTPPTRS